jgi:hypothetical protein
MSLRDLILGIKDSRIEAVPTPEWPTVDGSIFVRPLTAAERSHLLYGLTNDERAANWYGRLACKTLCDADGNRLFTDADADELGKHNGALLARICEVAERLAGLGVAVEDAKKN